MTLASGFGNIIDKDVIVLLCSWLDEVAGEHNKY